MPKIIVDGHEFHCSKELQEALMANGFDARPKAPPIDWSRIPDEYVAVAMDGSGFRYAYSSVPECQGIKWANTVDPLGWIAVDSSNRKGWDPTGWQDSLELRP